MKHLITLGLLTTLALAAPSCSTSVNSNTRAGVKKSKASHHRSDTSVRANVGTSIGL